MTLAALLSKFRRSSSADTPLASVPVEVTTLADVVTPRRYDALVRLYVEACEELHRHTRLATQLREELPDAEAERDAVRLIVKSAKLPRRTVPLMRHRAPGIAGERPGAIAELLDSVGGLTFPAVDLPPQPSGEVALRRAFCALAARTRATWADVARVRRELAQIQERLQDYRETTDALVALFAGTEASASAERSPAPPATGSLQEGLTLRLRPNQIVGALIAFLSLSILTGLLIVNSDAVTGHHLTPAPSPAAAATPNRPGRAR